MNLQELEDFLSTVNITAHEKPAKTFLEIARQPHYENVISNIYAFFFNINEEHGFNDLFIKSLIDCIKSTQSGVNKSFDDFYDFNIDTEFRTEANGRIDLLISNEAGAIIIENKIYHYLSNNLYDYWNSLVPTRCKEDQSIGIVLSLSDIGDIKHPHFINLTHKELLTQVMSNIGEYVLKANDKYFVFLKDFYQNIYNLSTKTMKNEELNFVLEHQNQIKAVRELDNGFKTFLKNEIQIACRQIEGVSLYIPRGGSNNEERLRYFESDKVKGLLFTIVFEGLLDNAHNLDIYIELRDDTLQRAKTVLKVERIADFPKEVAVLANFTSAKGHWAHFAKCSYNLTKTDIMDLSVFILNSIEDSKFLEAFRKLELQLFQEKRE